MVVDLSFSLTLLLSIKHHPFHLYHSNDCCCCWWCYCGWCCLFFFLGSARYGKATCVGGPPSFLWSSLSCNWKSCPIVTIVGRRRRTKIKVDFFSLPIFHFSFAFFFLFLFFLHSLFIRILLYLLVLSPIVVPPTAYTKTTDHSYLLLYHTSSPSILASDRLDSRTTTTTTRWIRLNVHLSY